MTTGTTNAFDLAKDLLAGVAAELLADGMTASAIPDRRYVTFGTPVAECSALVVSLERVYQGAVGGSETPHVLRKDVARVAAFGVWLFRCLSAVPQGEGYEVDVAPSVTALEADAALVMTDTYLLHRAVGKARDSGLFRSYALAAQVGAAVPLEPQGGIGGVQVTVTTELS